MDTERMSMTVVFVQYQHQLGASISVYDDIPAATVDRLSVESEKGELCDDSELVKAFYESHGYGKEVGQGTYKETPKSMMINDKCAIFCMKQAM